MNAEQIKDNFDLMYPAPRCELKYNSPYELLVAVILSAQCTDKRVNQVCEVLFKKYNTPYKMEKVSQKELESIIHSCGFYHNKAKNIISMSHDLVVKFNGQVPQNLDDLQLLAGVGRKTANVVFSEAFNGNAIAVDTHVLRVSNRLALVDTQNPYICEKALMEIFPAKYWSDLHQQMVLFGRYKCKAQRPDCQGCPFYDICVSDKKRKD